MSRHTPYPLTAPFTLPDESALIVSAPGLSVASVAFPGLLYPFLSPSDPKPLFIDCPENLQERFDGEHVTSRVLITKLLREKDLFYPFVVLICPEQGERRGAKDGWRREERSDCSIVRIVTSLAPAYLTWTRVSLLLVRLTRR